MSAEPSYDGVEITALCDGVLESSEPIEESFLGAPGTLEKVSVVDVTAFASLVAADFTANSELTQLLGESEVQAVVSEGPTRTVHSCLLAERVIMCTVFDKRSTLGLVRFRANRAVAVLDPVFRGLFEKVGLIDPAPGAQAFAAAAGREVDALFGD